MTLEPPRSELPAPGTRLGQRIVAFVEFAGPVSVAQVADHFAVPHSMAEWSMIELRNIGYLKYASGMPITYESRHRWNPDEPTHKGAPGGPFTPEARFGVAS